MDRDRDREFGEFVDARALVMRRTAYLLCGDWHRAEDIVQSALIKLYVAWSRVRKDSVDAYARKVLVRTAIDEGRRGFFQRERTVDVVPEPAVSDDSADFDLRLALDALPPGQRAVVVLRYWEDLSVTETARILGRTEGTVKSQAAKGLAALRDLLEDEPKLRIHRSEVIRKGKTKLARRRTAIATAMAFVLMAGLGTAGYLALPRPTTSAEMSAADSAADRNAVLTSVLRNANVLPSGVVVEDVPGTRALEFFVAGEHRNAVAVLRDTKGASALWISLVRSTGAGLPECNRQELPDCEIRDVNGTKVRTKVARYEDGVVHIDVMVDRGDGTFVQIFSQNVDQFSTAVERWPAGTTVTRPEPVLGVEELIKIATLPGLTL